MHRMLPRDQHRGLSLALARARSLSLSLYLSRALSLCLALSLSLSLSLSLALPLPLTRTLSVSCHTKNMWHMHDPSWPWNPHNQKKWKSVKTLICRHSRWFPRSREQSNNTVKHENCCQDTMKMTRREGTSKNNSTQSRSNWRQEGAEPKYTLGTLQSRIARNPAGGIP